MPVLYIIPEITESAKLFENILSINVAVVLVILVGLGYVIFGSKESYVIMSKKLACIAF